MTQKVPQPFESTNDAQSFFNELVGQTPQAASGSSFSLSGFSSDAVLNMFKNETNAMLKGEISKIRDLQSIHKQALELRLSTWQDRIGGAIDKIEQRIQVIANVQAPQKGEMQRKEEEERRPIAFALLKSIRTGLLQQTQELSRVQRDLIAEKLQTTHSDIVHELLDFLQQNKDPARIEKRFEEFLQTVLLAFKESYGQRGFQGLSLFIKNLQKRLPEPLQELFMKKFLEQFQKLEHAQVTIATGRSPDLSLILQLHEALAPTFAPDEPGVGASLTDESGIILHYFRGLADVHANAAMNQNTVIPQNKLTAQFLDFIAMQLLDQELLELETDILTYFPEFQDAQFLYEDEPRKITVGDLIAMQTGLVDVDELAALMQMDPQTLTADEKLNLLQNYPKLGLEPGTQEKNVSTTNMLLLAKIIEKTVNMPLEEYAEKNIFEKLNLPNTQFGMQGLQEKVAKGFRFNLFEDNWQQTQAVDNPYEIFSSAKDIAVWTDNLLRSDEGMKVLEQLGTEEGAIAQAITAAGFSIALVATVSPETDQKFSLYITTNREGFHLEPIAKELVDNISQVPIYGLAFVPYTISLDEEAIDAVSKDDKLQKLLKRFEGRYRSNELATTWNLVVQKNTVASLNKEYWGLQVSGSQSLFFIPTEITEETAAFIHADKPMCNLSFSKNQFVLQDIPSNLRDIIFKKQ